MALQLGFADSRSKSQHYHFVLWIREKTKLNILEPIEDQANHFLKDTTHYVNKESHPLIVCPGKN